MTTRRFRVTVDGEAFEVEVEEIAGRSAAGRPGDHATAILRDAEPPPGPPPVPSAPLPAGGAGALAPTGRPPEPARQGRPDAPRTSGARPRPADAAGRDGRERVEAPLPGTVVSVLAAPGAEVKAGQVLLVLEAMKMQNEIVAPIDGKVEEIAVEKGDTVALGDLLVTLV